MKNKIILIVIVIAIAVVGYLIVSKENNNLLSNISNPASTVESSTPCKDFVALSNFVSKNIQQPDSQNIMQTNENVITSMRWKRNVNEPFVSYPIIDGIQYYYGNKGVDRSRDFVISAIKNNSDTLDKTINQITKNLDLSVDSLNTLPFQFFSNQDIYLHILAFRKSDNLYSITMEIEGGNHQAPPVGIVTVACGKIINQYDKIYNALNFKKDESVQNSYNDDYITIADISPDNKVYALLGSQNHIKIADYYYFDNITAKLVSKDSYPAQCQSLELQKVGLGMRCVDQNYNQRTVVFADQAAKTCTGIFTAPAIEEEYNIGQNQDIVWKMPDIDTYYNLDIKLLDNKNQIIGYIYPGNWIKYNPVHQIKWDVKTVYNKVFINNAVGIEGNPPVYELKPDHNIVLQPGKYKLNLHYRYTDNYSGTCDREGVFQSNTFSIQ